MLTDWWHRFWNPHCSHCNPCVSCEYLKIQIEKLQLKNDELLQGILKGMTNETKPLLAEIPPELVKPKFVPWRVRRQMLEQEDAKAAQVMKQKITEINQTDKLAPPDDPDVIALEKELGVIEKERDGTGIKE